MIVYREFLNWMASAYRHIDAYRAEGRDAPEGLPLRRVHHMTRLIPIWRLHVEEARKNPLAISVYYDEWLADQAARTRLLEALTLPEKSLSLPGVSAFGRGSSFAPRDYQPQVTEGTANRAEHLADDEGFINMLRICQMDVEFMSYLSENWAESAARLRKLTSG